MLSHIEIFVFRASEGEKAENNFDSQVVQYEPAHKGSINTVTKLSPDLCVSGGSDQVNSSGFKRHIINKQVWCFKAVYYCAVNEIHQARSRNISKESETWSDKPPKQTVTLLHLSLSLQAVVVYDWKQGRMCQSFQGHNREVTKVVSIFHVCTLYELSVTHFPC